jgi:alpha-glucosidase
MSPTTAPWWRSAVIYQVYIRSFADGNGDGVGDIAGIRSRLPYLKSLGVDALWINPWYKSPMADHGYDVADYREIDPLFGTVAEAEQLIEEAHEHGIRIVPDIVPNHSSDQHAWFRAALAAGPGSPERERYIFRPGRGPDGALPPNDWDSRFGGPAWTRVADGEWYLHLFTPQQPDLNWQHPDVHAEFESVLRFWFERGVDGFRIDVAHGLVKDPELPDLAGLDGGVHPFWDRDEVHDIYRAWRKVADEYPGDRAFVAEAWTDTPERLAAYLRAGHPAHRLQLRVPHGQLGREGPARRHRRHLRDARHRRRPGHLGHVQPRRHAPRQPLRPKAARKWVANESLRPRRPPRPRTGHPARPRRRPAHAGPPRRHLHLPGRGTRPPRGRGPARGGPPGSRLGALRTHRPRPRRLPGADPLVRADPPYGFSPEARHRRECHRHPGCPSPPTGTPYTVEAQTGDETSMLELYRAALLLRREHPALGDGSLTWLDAPRRPRLPPRTRLRLRGQPLGRAVRVARTHLGPDDQRSRREQQPGPGPGGLARGVASPAPRIPRACPVPLPADRTGPGRATRDANLYPDRRPQHCRATASGQDQDGDRIKSVTERRKASGRGGHCWA